MQEEDPLFAGLKVLDVGSWIAGPVSATILADFGADVIKVEIPGSGDAYRGLATAPGTPKAKINYTWVQDARNKRSITLNLKTETGKTILRQLASDCDVYVTNHPLHMRRDWGLTYDDIKTINPRVIYASLTAYGEKGPERDREGFDLVAYWARSGLMDAVRSPGSLPAQSLPGMGDHPTAVALYAAIVTALLRRERTGKGSMVHTSLIANGVWSASCIASAVFANGDFSNYPSVAARHFTRELYETADNRFLQFTMVRSDQEITAFFDVLEATHLLQDPRFNSRRARVASGGALAHELRPLLGRHDADHWISVFNHAAVPVSLVGTLADLIQDPQLKTNNIIKTPEEDVGTQWVINHPLNIDGLPIQGVKKAPGIGEHTDEILHDLGYRDDEIENLRAEGAV
ncbi:MAG: CaiB/BaiF CoA-transferase family protein [Pseudomonadota bacterium]|nr:CaiB/BaiF CoA-transferase family protein [Pseudomonadota bacterium]